MKWILVTRILSETTEEFNNKIEKLSKDFTEARKEYSITGDPDDLDPPKVIIQEEDLIKKKVPFLIDINNIDYISKDFDGFSYIKTMTGEMVYIKEHPNSVMRLMQDGK